MKNNIDQMNKWTNEQTNKQTDEWMNESMNEFTVQTELGHIIRKNQWKHQDPVPCNGMQCKWMNEWMNKWIDKQKR